MPKSLNSRQLAKLRGMKISPQRRIGMVRHAEAKERSTEHNDEMIEQLANGRSIARAHRIAIRKVGV